jgi:hypothetical protein
MRIYSWCIYIYNTPNRSSEDFRTEKWSVSWSRIMLTNVLPRAAWMKKSRNWLILRVLEVFLSSFLSRGARYRPTKAYISSVFNVTPSDITLYILCMLLLYPRTFFVSTWMKPCARDYVLCFIDASCDMFSTYVYNLVSHDIETVANFMFWYCIVVERHEM